MFGLTGAPTTYAKLTVEKDKWNTSSVFDFPAPPVESGPFSPLPADHNYAGRAIIAHGAIAANLHKLREFAPQAKQMAIVKGGAYGHGLIEVAYTALRSGVEYLGVAQHAEALSLREGLDRMGIPREHAKIFTWIAHEGVDWQAALEADLELSVSNSARLAQICSAVRARREESEDAPPAKIHVELDTGMSRAGARLDTLPGLASALSMAQAEGLIEVVAAWSHLHSGDDLSEAGRATTARQRDLFEAGLAILAMAGIHPQLRHLAATSGILWHPDTHYDMVRPGIGLYGLSPNPTTATEEELGLTPVMHLQAPLTSVKRIEAGDTVSYGATWTATEPTWIGIVPLGYADGILRTTSNKAEVFPISEALTCRRPMAGRVCMDQFMVDLGPVNGRPPAEEGDIVVLFANGMAGAPTASEWAKWAGTINYEVVCRVGERVPRLHVFPATWVDPNADS